MNEVRVRVVNEVVIDAIYSGGTAQASFNKENLKDAAKWVKTFKKGTELLLDGQKISLGDLLVFLGDAPKKKLRHSSLQLFLRLGILCPIRLPLWLRTVSPL